KGGCNASSGATCACFNGAAVCDRGKGCHFNAPQLLAEPSFNGAAVCDRGKGSTSARGRARLACFNGAAVCDRGKASEILERPLRFPSFNGAAVCDRGKAPKVDSSHTV